MRRIVPAERSRTSCYRIRCLWAITIEGEVEGAVEGEVESGAHSADWNNSQADGIIDLTELLRVIQFYNSGGYHCAVDGDVSDEGYMPGAGDRSCVPHNSDYIDGADWEISLSELLRVIQFYNSGGYHYCPESDPPTEDGFCPGQA